MTSENSFDIDAFEIAQLKKKLRLEKSLAEFNALKAETQELCLQDNIRKLNLRIHQLQLEKWEAQEGKEKGDGRTAELKRDLLASRQEKREVEDKLNALRIELAGAKREIERLKVEVTALNAATEKSNKVFSEKIALSHEVATLKAENDALKAAQETAKANLAEKLTLQRQLTNVQLELENERKASKRSAASATEWSETQKKLNKEITDLKQSLTKETRAREKAETATNKMKDDYETRISVMQSKLEATNRKLEVLKKKPATTSTPVKNLKRPSSLALSELEQSAKRAKIISRPGAISEFSTTPFFKRQAAATPTGANDTIMTTSADTTTTADQTVAAPVVISTKGPTKVMLKTARTSLTATAAAKAKSKRRKSLLSEIPETAAPDVDEDASAIFEPTQEKENTKPISKSAAAGLFSSPNEAPSKGKAPSKKVPAKSRPKLFTSNIFSDDDGSGKIELDLGDKPLPALNKLKSLGGGLSDTFSPVKARPTGLKRINVGMARKKF